jgi:hypothetical protein
MNSNQSNSRDGSYHIRVNPLPKKEKPKPIPKPVEIKKEVKNDKKKIESKLAKIGIPATYCGITALVITLLASQLGVCD